MFTIEELVQLKQAGFTADEIMTLRGDAKPVEVPKQEVKPEPIPEQTAPSTDITMKEMLDAFTKNMNDQMEAFKSAIQLSNINHDSSSAQTTTVNDVVAQIIRPNGLERKR